MESFLDEPSPSFLDATSVIRAVLSVVWLVGLCYVSFVSLKLLRFLEDSILKSDEGDDTLCKTMCVYTCLQLIMLALIVIVVGVGAICLAFWSWPNYAPLVGIGPFVPPLVGILLYDCFIHQYPISQALLEKEEKRRRKKEKKRREKEKRKNLQV
eukprot:TRINITY_DN1228_c0_g1_i1.p1 TRINITY_DN1228_c0_g1~~TRINITY_DN1228_c0_g1_i1.p1  ORF type:complete len:155 (-),score=11.42 TRINITY_DN1228_c0_g1_i1:145-609(-)